MATSHSEHRRQEMHERAREQMLADFDKQKQDLAKEAEKHASGQDRFVNTYDTLEESLKKQTIGLVRLEDFQKRRAELEEEKLRQAAQTDELKPQEKIKKKKSKRARATLSFAGDDEEEDQPRLSKPSKKPKTVSPQTLEASTTKGTKKTSVKNPSVDTSFLPDRQREEQERQIREDLRQEWLRKQEKMKQEEIEITYSYWDGSGHRKTVKCKKGDTIAQFLEKCRQQFPELRGANVDNLMYIKEDLIIPHHLSFYDMIVSKSRGKSGPLFNFDVHEDVRMVADASVEKDESHAGKVVERNWYNRNKHIFPASRWEVFELGKDYGGYTIRDSNAKK